jgi:hypothetical protein
MCGPGAFLSVIPEETAAQRGAAMSPTGSPSRLARGSAAACLSILVVSTACASSGGDSYQEFKSAIRSNASCQELFDQRNNFDDRRTLDKIDADLDEIGCDSPSSERNDL